MKNAVVSISCLCILAALCGQLLNGNTYRNAFRFMLGLEIMLVMLETARKALSMLN